jgi:4-hydroxy-tetrahydrodipicolinate synthase
MRWAESPGSWDPVRSRGPAAPARLKPIVDHAIAAGVHALVANGNTGEFYGLTVAEAETMVHAVGERWEAARC